MDVDKCNNFVIHLPLKNQTNGINIAFGQGNQLIAHTANFQQQETKSVVGKKKTGTLLQHVSWDISLHNDIGRKLINESHQLFRLIQQVPPEATESIDRNPVLLKFSRKYRSILEACILEIKQILNSKSAQQDELNDLMKLLKVMELIWSLCEILFIEKLPPGSVLLHLLKWCSLHFPENDERIESLTSNFGSHEAHTHPEYWNAFHCLLLQGRMIEAQKLLSMHPNYQTEEYDPFSSLDELIRKMPMYSGNQGQSVGEFEMKWKHWQDECKHRLEDGDFDTYDHLKTACRVLCGDEHVFEELKELSGTWYNMLISMLFYMQPVVTASEIQHYIKYTIESFGGENYLGTLDNILLAAFEMDIYQIVKECSQNLSNWWLSAHLTDILFHCGLLTQRNLNYGSNLRESLITEYASSLISHGSLWLVVADYFLACSEHGSDYLHLFIERIPITSEKKASKVIRLCERLGMHDHIQSICRLMAVTALKENRLGCALTWSLKSKDNSFTILVSNKLLNEYSKTGQFAHMDLLDYLGSSILSSERLTFLGKYREFHRLLEANEAKQAAELLLNLVVSKMAPMDFWPLLFNNALALLEDEEIYYDGNDTAKFMSLLNTLDQNKESVFSESSEKAKETLAQKIEHFRLALVRNLSRTLVSIPVM